MRSATFIVAALSVSTATALVTGSPFLRRQSIPTDISTCASQCENAGTVEENCANKNAAGNGTNPVICTCTSDFVNALQSCYQCAITNSALTAESANDALSAIATSCTNAGQPVGSPSVSGGSDNSAPPAPSGSGSTTAPAKKNSAEQFILGSSLVGVSAFVGLGGILLV